MIIDEAHARTLNTDVLFGLIKDIARFRSDLKLRISSATLDAQKFSNCFAEAPIFRIPGKHLPGGPPGSGPQQQPLPGPGRECGPGGSPLMDHSGHRYPLPRGLLTLSPHSKADSNNTIILNE